MTRNKQSKQNPLKIDIKIDLQEEFRHFIKMNKDKVSESCTYITVGLEGTSNRGVSIKKAKTLFEVMEEYPKVNFMLLLKADIDEYLYVPNNCMIGVTVSDNDEIHRIEDVWHETDANNLFLSFVPLRGDVGSSIETDIVKAMRYFVLEGALEDEKREWEENLILLRSEHLHNTLLVYEKSVQKHDYDMHVTSDKLFGYRRLSWF